MGYRSRWTNTKSPVIDMLPVQRMCAGAAETFKTLAPPFNNMPSAELDFPPDTLPHEAACNRHLQAQLAANSCAREYLLASDHPGQKTTINNQYRTTDREPYKDLVGYYVKTTDVHEHVWLQLQAA